MLRAQAAEQAHEPRGETLGVADEAVAAEEVLRLRRAHQHHVVVGIDEMFGQVRDVPDQSVDGIGVEGGQRVFAAAEDDAVVHNHHVVHPLREMLAQHCAQIRVLPVRDDEDLAHERRETQDRGHAPADFAHRSVAAGAAHFFVGQRVAAGIAGPARRQDGITSVHPGQHDVDRFHGGRIRDVREGA